MKKSNCPICCAVSKVEYHPFCSKRCADVDLGKWLGERYTVSGELAEKSQTTEGKSSNE